MNTRKISTRNYHAPEYMPRFISKISIDSLEPTHCWEYRGYYNFGYGQFHLGKNRPVYAHRYNAEQMFGPLSPYLTIDHLCRNRKCVRPSHLELVTERLNNLRGESPTAKNALKLTCPRGHLYDYYSPTRNARKCRHCENENRRMRCGTTYRKNGPVCKQGHLFTAENTYVSPKYKGRTCRTCAKIASAAKYLRKKAKQRAAP